jgi:hypothetical protein
MERERTSLQMQDREQKPIGPISHIFDDYILPVSPLQFSRSYTSTHQQPGNRYDGHLLGRGATNAKTVDLIDDRDHMHGIIGRRNQIVPDVQLANPHRVGNHSHCLDESADYNPHG